MFKRKVQHGQKLGRTIGFPTLNFKPGLFGKYFDHGVYACQVRINDKVYKGAMHFGPKFPLKKEALEMHVIGFSEEIYAQFISFKVLQKIRSHMTFRTVDELKKQIEKDISLINSQ